MEPSEPDEFFSNLAVQWVQGSIIIYWLGLLRWLRRRVALIPMSQRLAKWTLIAPGLSGACALTIPLWYMCFYDEF